jgi:hypothetical protein
MAAFCFSDENAQALIEKRRERPGDDTLECPRSASDTPFGR